MRIDVGTFAQNFKSEVGGTPSWGTSVGQSETLSHKITRQGKEDIALGMIYRAIDVSKIETEFGKGGNRTEENPIVAAALFDKVFVNGKRVEDGKFILLLIKQVGDNYVEQHYGRLTLKYPSSVVYDGETYNEDVFSKINKTMGYSSDWTWFASDISVISQDELHFRIHCFNRKVVFASANDKKAKTEELMKNDGVIDPVDNSKVYRIQKISPKASVDEYVDILKDLIVRCGGKTWDAVRILGALYHEYIDDSMYQQIRTKLDIKESSDAEFRKGRDLGPFVVSKDLIVEIDPNTAVEKEIDETDEESEEVTIELPERNPRTYKQYPLNLILYGAPGTGKTYSTMELACSIFDRGTASIDDICEGNTHSNREEVMKHYNDLVKQGFITFTTFHQSYGYEDFIQGLRPDDKSDTLKFVPVDGVFKKIVNKAIKDQTNNYVIIIDEINRANISKVLGELITLLETDKRWGEINQLSTKLPSGQPFAVPNNLYVIGTMNSADKSISLIDAALRRRFEFVEVSVNYETIANSIARRVLEKINERLEGQLDSSDLLIGHAYFIGKNENGICDVLNHNVIPLLYEYFFDSKAKVKDILEYALDGLNYEIKDERGKRLRVVKKAE